MKHGVLIDKEKLEYEINYLKDLAIQSNIAIGWALCDVSNRLRQAISSAPSAVIVLKDDNIKRALCSACYRDEAGNNHDLEIITKE